MFVATGPMDSVVRKFMYAEAKDKVKANLSEAKAKAKAWSNAAKAKARPTSKTTCKDRDLHWLGPFRLS